MTANHFVFDDQHAGAVDLGTLIDQVEYARIAVSNRLAKDTQKRTRYGQYFTPDLISRFMAGLFHTPTNDEVNILDAGGGNGMLTAALVSEMCQRDDRPSAINATLWEIDASLHGEIAATLELCRRVAERCEIDFDCHVIFGDFIADAVDRLMENKLFESQNRPFDLAILNPPYRKLASDTKERSLLRSVGIETSNLYSAFVWLATELLAEQGQLVAITPRSFMNGTYFRPFRQHLASTMQFQRIHVYESRNKVFGNDDVLQENVIFHAVKGGDRTPVQITASISPDDEAFAGRTIDSSELIYPGDPESVIHVVPDEIDAKIGRTMRAMPNVLSDLGVSVSTGRVVDFRARERLVVNAQADDVPLIYPRNLVDGFVDWPVIKKNKPNAISHIDENDPLLLPSGWYVVVKRLSSKEEKRRVVAAAFDPGRVDHERIAFDNKLNVLHCGNAGLSRDLAIGITIYLNGTFVDSFFRQFSGHTQVNAGDLRSIRFPSPNELTRIGSMCKDGLPKQHDINTLLRKEIRLMSQGDDPVAAKQKKDDAVAILKSLATPQGQLNERSALTLLGLLDLEPEMGWDEISAPLRGVTDLMEWMAKYYGKQYAPNTRETIRRFTLHQFIEMGLVTLNPDKPERPPNSPKNVYQIEPSALGMLKTYGTKKWSKSLSTYLKSAERRNRLVERSRSLTQIPVTLPNGEQIKLSAGGQNILIKEIIEHFAPRFTPGGRVVYVGDAGKKHLLYDTEYLAGLGVEIEPHGKMPDVVIHFKERDWLVLVEAVTSHGPVNLLRHNQLKDLFAESTSGLVFVTAFIDRHAMRNYLPEIAWETEVWIADSSDHLIHFNGERFLGPYSD